MLTSIIHCGPDDESTTTINDGIEPGIDDSKHLILHARSVECTKAPSQTKM